MRNAAGFVVSASDRVLIAGARDVFADCDLLAGQHEGSLGRDDAFDGHRARLRGGGWGDRPGAPLAVGRVRRLGSGRAGWPAGRGRGRAPEPRDTTERTYVPVYVLTWPSSVELRKDGACDGSGRLGRDRLSRSSLHYAVVDGDMDRREALLVAGGRADAASVDVNGWRPLHMRGSAISVPC